jgi:hypothetical protein
MLRFTMLAIAAIVLLTAAGAAYEAWRETRDAAQFPPPAAVGGSCPAAAISLLAANRTRSRAQSLRW